ncbi:MAG: hypothetical protein HYY84_14510 [Deltaproteobacteria bacterium]|nr:hypothetical protein [Deltaproteobacteria bacterium]
MVIAVDGIDGSGKTVFANRLASSFVEAGFAAVHISVDDFRRAVDFARPDKSEIDIYADEYFDFAELNACLQSFQRGDPTLAVPVFDSRVERRIGTRSIDSGNALVLIVEGVFVLRVPLVATAFCVYLASSLESARARILERDTKKGRSDCEVNRRIDARYFPSQERYQSAYRPRDRADLVIENDNFALPLITRATFNRLPDPFADVMRKHLDCTGAAWSNER